jgi:hypothetical protein
MFKEPRSILFFIYNYFDSIRELFDIQSNEGVIRNEILQIVLEKKEQNILKQLVEYKILKTVNNDYKIREVYFELFEFVLYQFKPLLPETIEKYNNAISEIFRKIKDGIADDKNILIDRIQGIAKEIEDFTESVEKNTIRLLNETRDLKANVENIDYRQKVQKATFWIEYYISPLNLILDINHTQSIAYLLHEISEYANYKRLSYSDENIRSQFEKLYSLLKQTNIDLLKQSKILSNELLPLIERIKTESQILSGMIYFLNNSYRIEPPNLLKTSRDNPYSKDIYLNTKEYFEQFQLIEDLFIEDEELDFQKWIFDRSLYKNILMDNLPIDGFFNWCSNVLIENNEELSTEKFFAITSLLFEKDINISFPNSNEFIEVQIKNSKLSVPIIKISKNGVSKTT